MQKLFSGKRGSFGLLFMAVLILTILGCGGSPAAGEPDNFRGVKWGSDSSSLSGFTQFAKDGEFVFFEKQNDPLQMNDIKLEQVIYGFYKGRFYTAMVYFPAVGFSRMKDALAKQFGEPTQPDNTPSKLVWDGPNLTVLLTSSNGADLARLAYLYKPIQLEVELKK